VGVPARGKTFMAKSLKRHFDWVGLKSEIFSVVEYRREAIGVVQPPEFFKQSGSGETVRLAIAQQVLDDALAVSPSLS
jgi:6-phosphofructo-2-kinase